jgi:hypothetical protein
MASNKSLLLLNNFNIKTVLNQKTQNQIQKEVFKGCDKGLFGRASALRQLYNKKVLLEYAVPTCCPTPKCTGGKVSMTKGKEEYSCARCGISYTEENFVPQLKGDTFLAFLDRGFKLSRDKMAQKIKKQKSEKTRKI